MAVHGDRPKVRRMKELGQDGAELGHSDGAAAGHSDRSAGEPSDGAAAGHSEGAAGEPSYGVAEVRIVDLPPVDNEVTVMVNGDQSLALTPDFGRCTSMISFHSFTLIWTVKIFLLGQC